MAPSTTERRGMGGTEEGLNQMACVCVYNVYNTHMWRPRTPWYMCGDQRTALGVSPLLLPCLSLLFITAYARLASVSSQGFSCLSLQPHHRNTDITDMRHYMQLSVSLGDSHAERHPDPTSTVPMSLPLRLSNGIS